ncbi:HNH endonuclease [Nocardia alba]|nr:HNH endonuclease [Nocardia alba]
MYCEDSAGTDIEHFRPKSGFPATAFVWNNHLFACSHCNSNEKRDRFPADATGRALLIDPTTMDPFDHLTLSVGSGLYVGRDEIGRTSIDVFGLNREICAKGRLRAWSTLCKLIERYPVETDAERLDTLAILRDFPFQGVRRWLAVIVESGDRAGVVPPTVKDTVGEYTELIAEFVVRKAG